jgi:hypothetical protein
MTKVASVTMENRQDYARARFRRRAVFLRLFGISAFFSADIDNVSVLGTSSLFTKRQARVYRGCHPF